MLAFLNMIPFLFFLPFLSCFGTGFHHVTLAVLNSFTDQAGLEPPPLCLCWHIRCVPPHRAIFFLIALPIAYMYALCLPSALGGQKRALLLPLPNWC